MGLVTIPKVSELADGEIALGTDVLANDQEIVNTVNGNLDQTNIDLSMTPTWTSAHIFSNAVTINGLTTLTGGLSLTGTVSGNHTISGIPTFTNDVIFTTAKKLYLNFANNTHITEGTPNVVSMIVNGGVTMTWDKVNDRIDIGSTMDMAFATGQKIFFDGGGGNDSIRGTGGDTLVMEIQGSDRFKFHGNGEIELLENVDPPTANRLTRKGPARGWVSVSSAGGSTTVYNITSTTKTVTGNYTITWDTDFSVSDYVTVATVKGSTNILANIASHTTGTTLVTTVSTAGGGSLDANFNLVAFGNQ